ncbi:hypothetical protein ABZ079_21975 [Streptomyces sp. NPDC006314]|uniref:hypothetical protein n=1 Tax=Streptomyces sp. NPDC006314 TaxID=3154475 RepID=UPI0033B519DE
MRLRLRASAVALSVAAALGGLGVTAPTASASARHQCTLETNAYYCYNVYAAKVYDNFDGTGKVVGYMYTTYSWFSCRLDKGAYVGGPHPYRWLMTKADNGVWGFMKDTSISSETNPVISCSPE